MQITVMGLGNILYGDEGFGVRIAEQLYTQFDFPEHVEILDAGTQGSKLLRYLEESTHLLILDAVDFNLTPGTLVTEGSATIPRYLSGHKISVHQSSFSEVLALGVLQGHIPEHIHLVGMQPVATYYGTSLSTVGFEQLPNATTLALDVLKQWNVSPRKATGHKYFHTPYTALESFMSA